MHLRNMEEQVAEGVGVMRGGHSFAATSANPQTLGRRTCQDARLHVF